MLANQLSEIILRSLDLELYSNLVFYAEKYLCDNPSSEEIKYYLSKGYIGEGKYHKAYQLLKNTKSEKCRYLFTLICIKLNKFIDAEKALLTDKYYSKGIGNREIETIIPNGAAGYFLLGVVLEKMGRKNEAFIAYKKSVELDPFMWCAYEKMCKIDPSKVDNNKIYTELNPKILIFNKKFLNLGNPQNNINNLVTNPTLNVTNVQTNTNLNNINLNINNNNNANANININITNNNSGSGSHNKKTNDFLLTPDDNNAVNESNDSINHSNFGMKRNRQNIGSNSSELNKYRQILDFNTNSANMTPVVHKEEVEYQNINYQGQIPLKVNNNPFVFSSSPNHVQLEFSSVSNSNNNNNNNNNNNSSNNISSSGFNITNNNNTTNNINNSLSDNSNSRINPFNINVSNNNNTTNNNISGVATSGVGIINLPNPQPGSNVNNNLESTPTNLFNNIHLNISNQHSISNFKKKTKNASLGNNIQISPYNQPPLLATPAGSEINLNKNEQKEHNYANENKNALLSQAGTSSSFQDISQLLKYYSEIVKKMSLYECQSAIDLLTKLPKNHIDSPYTYSALGRCYFELGKYKECEKYYNLSLVKDPSHLEGMEYLSSCLWHLKDQYQCCNLAHRALDQSQFAPETWIILGNCFSLQKEHEIAIKFFTRATQINPSFAYAYTLSGHEYVDNENYAQANQCYKTALTYDDRHFNAWWGLGHIQLKEQNFNDAIKHFKKALSINQKSGILHFYLASAYLQNRDISKALSYLLKAEKENNDNPMIKYQISNIYISKGKFDEALEILLALDEKMPKEAPIHIAIGKIFKIKKDYANALKHFNIAIDLDPKDSNLAKSLIERLYSESGNENVFPGNK